MWSLIHTQPKRSALRDPQRAAHVARPHRGGEPVAGGVRPRDRLLLVAEALHRDHRPEDLALDHLVVLAAGPRRRSARRRSPAGRARPPPVTISACSGRRSRKPSTRSRWRCGVDAGRASCPARACRPTTSPCACSASPDDDVVVDAAGGEHAGRRGAVLAGVVVARAGDRLQRALEADVVEHDHRRLAAELEVHALERVGGGARDVLAGVDRPRQRDHVHVGVRDQRLPGRAARAR